MQHWESDSYLPLVDVFNVSLPVTHKTNRILLLGDSLIGVPSRYHDLVGKISDRIKERHYPLDNLIISYNGPFGTRVADWAHEGAQSRDTDSGFIPNLTAALTPPPDIVVYYGDSDCSDVDEDELSDEGVDHVRKQFNDDIRLLIERILATGAHLVLAGPGGMLEICSKYSSHIRVYT